MPPIIDDATITRQNLLYHIYNKNAPLLALMLIASLFWTIPAYAQLPATLIAEESQTVTITPDNSVYLRYRAPQAQWVSITTQAQDATIDTVVIVRDADHNTLAYADDTPTVAEDGTLTWDTNASLHALYLPDAGDYWIVVDSFNGVSLGDVDLILNVIDPFEANEEILDDGAQYLTINLPPAHTYDTIVTLTTGQTLTIIVRDLSGRLDPLLTIHEEDGDLLAIYHDHQSDDATLDKLDVWASFTAENDITLRLGVRDTIGRAGILAITLKTDE